MATVKDIVIRKPSAEEQKQCESWPIWRCDVSEFDWAYTDKETCLILEGEVTIADKQGQVSFGPGDFVIFPVDLECTWKVTKPVKKHYNFG